MKLDELRAKLQQEAKPVSERTQSDEFIAKYREASARYDDELRQREHYRDCSECKRPFFVALDDDLLCGFCRGKRRAK